LLCRRVLDLAVAAVLLVLSLPVLALVAVAIKLTSRGPVVYAQSRVGKNGRVFTMYKLRSMIHNCESLTGPRWAIPGDPRVTPIGQFLRRTHLDEIPQLWNVLRGDMSLIGPRPERPEFVQQLKRALSNYEDRLVALPGITGLAQVQLPPDTDLESVRRKLACDLYYVNHLSPGLDLVILLRTAAKALGIPSKWVSGWLRVPCWTGLLGQMEGGLGNRRSLAESRAA
jgi:lipopolysaccharide/colanic/teichoic acid biosynthesis glycosyltransferase